MNWIKLQTDIFSSPEYILADPTDRATWMSLMVFCAKNENHGTIVGCREWKDRTWQQLAAVTLQEVNKNSDLWRWVGNSITVRFYPSDTEQLLKTKREASAKGHQQKAAKRSNVAIPQTTFSQCHNQDSGNATTPAKTENVAMQSRVEQSRADKNRSEQTAHGADPQGWISKCHEDFAAWFSNYPKQIGEIEAQREWMACSSQRPPTGEMIAILREHIASKDWQSEEGKYIPRAAAYLNGQRWRDKLTPGKIIKQAKQKQDLNIDEAHAIEWLGNHYVGVDTAMTFEQWPLFAQNDYLDSLKKPSPQLA